MLKKIEYDGSGVSNDGAADYNFSHKNGKGEEVVNPPRGEGKKIKGTSILPWKFNHQPLHFMFFYFGANKRPEEKKGFPG